VGRVAKTCIVAVGLAGLVWLAGAGCALSRAPTYDRQALAADLLDSLREEALMLPDYGRRERLVTGLIQVRELLVGETILKPSAGGASGPVLPEPEGGAAPAPKWATLFAPASLVIGFFTRSKDFDGQPGDDGLEVRLQPLDQFGDPTKAVGQYRIEMFAYRRLSGEQRGDRLAQWYVPVLDLESNRKYYDPVDRSYVFPLLWNAPVEPGTPVIIQVTYFPPGGFQEKLFAQRVIKIGPE
jgi:hypothetical protein